MKKAHTDLLEEIGLETDADHEIETPTAITDGEVVTEISEPGEMIRVTTIAGAQMVLLI